VRIPWLVPILLACAASASPLVQTVEDVVALHLKSRGGLEHWTAVETMRLTGRLTAGDLELPLVMSNKRPNLTRQELRSSGTTIVSGFDGKIAWSVAPSDGAGGARELSGPLLELLRQQADFDGPLIGFKEKGHSLAFLGEESVGGRRAYKLRIATKAGEIHDFIDAESGALLRRTAQVTMGGVRMLYETDASDHRPIEGVLVPHLLETSLGGEPAFRIAVDKVEFNVPLEDGIFQKPDQNLSFSFGDPAPARSLRGGRRP
jgi:hypothetical protein